MGTTKVSNRSESPGRHGGNYKIELYTDRKAARKKAKPILKVELEESKEVTGIQKELGIHKSRKKSFEDKLESRKKIEEDIELAKNDIKKALEKIGNIKYYTEL